MNSNKSVTNYYYYYYYYGVTLQNLSIDWISQLGAAWWPRAGDLGWWWQNESPRQQCSTSSRGGYCPRQRCSTVPPSCVLPPPSSVPSSSDIDVHICTQYVLRRRLLAASAFSMQCWKYLQKSSKPHVNEDVFQAIVPISRGRSIFSCVKEEDNERTSLRIDVRIGEHCYQISGALLHSTLGGGRH